MNNAKRDEILDLVRGLSALAVMLMHARGFLLCDLAEARSPGVAAKAAYFLTGLGHEAVMVFFVLSGYFVGGSVLQSLRGDGFSSARYALVRLTRLWTVLLPALVLTLAVDRLGSHFNPEAYAGCLRQVFMSGPDLACPADWGLPVFLGNVFFVQTILTPVYGSNGPLWSLANEFWYYVLFPLLACGLAALLRFFRQPSVPSSGFPTANGKLPTPNCQQAYQLPPSTGSQPSTLDARPTFSLFAFLFPLSAFLLLSLWLPRLLLAQGLIWLFGAGVAWLARHPASKPVQSIWFRAAGGLALLAMLLVAKSRPFAGCDYVIGLVFAVLCLSLLGPWHKPGWWKAASSGLSSVSYTLYVVHFPLLFFIAAVFLHGRQFQPDAQGFLVLALASLLVFLISAGMWWLFERHTDSIRRWIGAKLAITRKP